MVSQEQIARFREEGYLVLEGFAEEAACLAVRERAEAIVAGFDFGGDISVFSTTEQSHAQDEYFLTSAYAVRCFLESGAEIAELGEGEVPAVNKIGHALHDLDPVFEEFSYTPRLKRLLGELGYEQPAFIQSMYIFKSPGLGGRGGAALRPQLLMDRTAERLRFLVCHRRCHLRKRLPLGAARRA